MASSLTRGPLPAKVYWRRRLVLVGGALALVLALGRVLGGGSDGSSEDPGAAQVAGEPTSSAPSASPSTKRKSRPNQPISPPSSRAPELAVPDGPCADDDISVTPSVVDAVAGRDVTFQLDLRTIVDEACTWRVSSERLTVAITSGADDIWSSQQCPVAIPVQDVIVRSAVSASITMVWADARRSDDECSRLTGWALPGYYHVAASALGGEPVEVQFELTKPEPEVVVETTPPSGEGGQGTGNGTGSGTGNGAGAGSGGSQPGGGEPNQPDDDATDAPSGAVEPNG